MACHNINTIITNYKSSGSVSIDDFKTKLFNDYSLMTKYYEDTQLLLIYNKFDTLTKNSIDQECRSLVIDMETWKVVSYTCPKPIANREAQQFLLNNNDLPLSITKCYEGSILSLFNHKGKWFLATRRCIDSKDSVWHNFSFYDMFNDVLTKENTTFDEFTSKLNPEYGYYFILIHHSNKNVIDYTSQFGENYTKLCLAFVRLKSDQSEVMDYEFENYNHIFKPEVMTMDDFAQENQELNINVNIEGIIIKTFKNDRPYLFKLQSNSYQFCKAIGPDSNMFKGYVYLYQTGALKNYIENNADHKNLEKIVNQYNPSESFHTVGVVDCVFKVLTTELFELYSLLWSLDTGVQLNTNLYNILPKEFKDILYGLRGLNFKSKAKTTNKPFSYNHIYHYIKSIDIEQLCSLLRQRKLMFNMTVLNKTNEHYTLFRTISNKCDKVQLKLMAIFTTKLFPDITATDIPTETVSVSHEVI
jgi:hypothetical protein